MNDVLLDRKKSPLAKYIKYMLYAIAFVMPLHAIVGDIFIWITILMGIVDHICYKQSWKIKSNLQTVTLAFLTWSFISALLSKNLLWAQAGWFYQLGACGGVFFLMTTYLTSPKDWKRLVYSVFASSVLVGLIGIYQYMYISETQMHEWVDAKKFPTLMRRMYSTLQNPNLYGAYLLMILSLAGTYILECIHYKKWQKVACVTPVALFLLICMTLTYSRGVWISFVCIVVYWGLLLERKLLFSLLLIPLVLYFYHGEVAGRLWSLFSGNDTSVALRWALWDSTTYMIKEHPIFGIGWNTFWKEYPDYNYFIQSKDVIMFHAHNLYLNMMAETGIPGAILFFITLVSHSIEAHKLSKSFINNICAYSTGAVLIGVLISGLSDHELYSHQVALVFWQLMGLTAAICIHGKENKAQ